MTKDVIRKLSKNARTDWLLNLRVLFTFQSSDLNNFFVLVVILEFITNFRASNLFAIHG